MRRTDAAGAAVFLCLAAFLFAGCAGKNEKQREEAAGGARAPVAKLVIISPHWEGIRREMTDGFREWHRKNGGGEVEVEWLDQGGTSDDLKFIKAGFSRSPEGIGVDLFYGGGVDPYVELAGAGLLAPCDLPAEFLDGIPEELNGVPLYDPERRWFGASLAGFGILYNKNLLERFGLAAPAEWADLAAPGMMGLVGSSDPRHSGSMHIMYEIILQVYGWDRGWETIGAMAANARNFPKSANQVSSDLAVGEVAAGLCIDTYAFSAIEQVGADRLGFVLPRKATVITPDPIALLKGAPNRTAAEAFIRFSLSPEGQRLWMFRKGAPGGPKQESLNKMSILPSIYKEVAGKSNIDINPFEQPAGFIYDFKKGSARWNLLNDLTGTFLIDPHDAMAAAVKKAGGDPAKLAALFAPPVSEEEAMKLAAETWNDEVARNKTINRWAAEAKKRYK